MTRLSKLRWRGSDNGGALPFPSSAGDYGGLRGLRDYGDYGDTLLNPQLSASAWARGAVGEDRGRSLAARRSRKGRRAERAAN
jgi:hypothetical protein